MNDERNSRRDFLTGLLSAVGGLGALAFLARSAEARSRWRGGWGYYGRGWSHRRFYGGYGGYGGYYPRVYNRGYYGVPYVVPRPVVPVQPYYYNNFYYPPFGAREARPAIDALRMLES